MFQTGQKVICIVESHYWETFDWPAPEKGRIYTVSGIDSVAPLSLHLRELSLGVPSYWAVGFRPVVERKTDISIFKALLQPNNIRENA